MEHVVCNLCGADAPEFVCEAPGGRRMHRCPECGFVYVTPVPGPDELLASHEQGYYENQVGQSYESLLPAKTREWEELFSELKQRVEPGPLVEVGCGRGYCSALARDLGWMPIGVDIAREDIEFAREKHRIGVVHGTLTDAEFVAGRFNAVIMWSVIEHLADPRATLAEAFRILRPGGIVSVSTCNVQSAAARQAGAQWRYFTLPGHLCFFSPSTLRRMLEDIGFTVDHVSGGVEFSSKPLNAFKRMARFFVTWFLPPEAAARLKKKAVKTLAGAQTPDQNAGENFIIYARKPGTK